MKNGDLACPAVARARSTLIVGSGPGRQESSDRTRSEVPTFAAIESPAAPPVNAHPMTPFLLSSWSMFIASSHAGVELGFGRRPLLAYSRAARDCFRKSLCLSVRLIHIFKIILQFKRQSFWVPTIRSHAERSLT